MAGDLETRAPIIGESLDGYIAEMTAQNDLLWVARISRWGGVEYAHRPTLSTKGWDDLPALAEVLEVDIEELRLRSYPLTLEDPNRRQFFGSTIHCADIRTRERFFSPAALAGSEYHRALWQLKVPWDIVTGEILINTCPDCNTVQRWRHSVGVRYCDHDVADLSSAKTNRLPDDILDDVGNAISLIHPDPANRAKSLAMLPECLQHADGGMVLELVLQLTPLVHPDCSWTRGSRCWKNDPIFLGEGVARAWRMLPGWPHSLHARIAADMASSEARWDDGAGGATRRLLNLNRNDTRPAFVRSAIQQVVDLMDLDGPAGRDLRRSTAGVKEAAREIGLKESVLSEVRRSGGMGTIPAMQGGKFSPRFRRAEIAEIVRDVALRWDLSRAAPRLGIPLYGLEQIVAMGDLPLLDHPFFEARYNDLQTTEADVDNLIERLIAKAAGRADTFVPIAKAMRSAGIGLKPWGIAIRAMLEGHVPFHVEDPISRPMTKFILVDRQKLLDAVSENKGGYEREFEFTNKLSKRDAGEALLLAVRDYTKLFSDLPTSSEPVVDVKRVERLAFDFIAPAEIALRTGMTPAQVTKAVKLIGIVRASLAGYSRAEVEAAMFKNVAAA